MGIKEKVFMWFVPKWFKAILNDGKRYAGGVSLGLWVLIYAIPELKPEWKAAAEAGKGIQKLLEASGWDFGQGLLDAGLGLTAVGWLDSALKLSGVRKPNSRLPQRVKHL